jgi:hypothetical protein
MLDDEKKPDNPDESSVGVDDKPVESGFVFNPEDESINENNANTDKKTLTWTASEFTNHEKSITWYIILLGMTIVLGLLLLLITRSILSIVIVFLSGIAFAVVGSHKPKELHYEMNHRGIKIENKQYSFDEFRQFIINPETNISEATLIPTKRFMPSVSILFDPKDEEKIIEYLSSILPYEERRQPLIDNLMHKLHF